MAVATGLSHLGKVSPKGLKCTCRRHNQALAVRGSLFILSMLVAGMGKGEHRGLPAGTYMHIYCEWLSVCTWRHIYRHWCYFSMLALTIFNTLSFHCIFSASW